MPIVRFWRAIRRRMAFDIGAIPRGLPHPRCSINQQPRPDLAQRPRLHQRGWLAIELRANQVVFRGFTAEGCALDRADSTGRSLDLYRIYQRRQRQSGGCSYLGLARTAGTASSTLAGGSSGCAAQLPEGTSRTAPDVTARRGGRGESFALLRPVGVVRWKKLEADDRARPFRQTRGVICASLYRVYGDCRA